MVPAGLVSQTQSCLQAASFILPISPLPTPLLAVPHFCWSRCAESHTSKFNHAACLFLRKPRQDPDMGVASALLLVQNLRIGAPETGQQPRLRSTMLS